MGFRNTTRRVTGETNKYYSPDGRILTAREVGKNGFPTSNLLQSEPYIAIKESGTHSSGADDRSIQNVRYHGFGREAFE